MLIVVLAVILIVVSAILAVAKFVIVIILVIVRHFTLFSAYKRNSNLRSHKKTPVIISYRSSMSQSNDNYTFDFLFK